MLCIADFGAIMTELNSVENELIATPMRIVMHTFYNRI